ncbi:MAG: hydrogenase iron-sulfur subunit [Kiritimatiellia bacterium]
MKHVIVYRCQQCGGRKKIFADSRVREFVLACSGQLEPIHILRAFEDGNFGVCLVHCDPGACRTLSGARAALRQVNFARRLLEEVAVNPGRVRTIAYHPGCDLHSEINLFFEQLKHLEEHPSEAAPEAPERKLT